MLSERMDHMNSNVTRRLRALGGLVLIAALAAAGVMAQQPSPSPQPPAETKTQSSAPQEEATTPDESDYTVTSSVELGYRGLRVNGDINKFQSDLNYKAGPRIFDSSLLVQRDESEGAPFDQLLVTSTGWGADPQGHVRFSVEKAGWYRFDGNYRKFKYFRFLNNIANPNYSTSPTSPVTGQHGYDTRQRVGDFDLTLLPKNERVRFNFGYSPERYGGPAYTTWHYGGDDFVLLSQTDWKSNNFRLGADWRLGPVDFSFQQGFRRFEENTTIDNEGLNLGVNPAATSFNLRDMQRLQPIRGKVNHTRFSAHTLLAKRVDITGRFVYSNATSDFDWSETITGNNFNSRISGIPSGYSPSASNQTILTFGNWTFAGHNKKPNVLGDLGVTFLVTDKFRVSNLTRYETFQINGGVFYNGTFDITRVTGNQVLPRLSPSGGAYEYTKYRKVSNTVEGDYEINNDYSVRFGYRYGTRRIERAFIGNNLASNGAPLLPSDTHEEQNETHSFFGGIKARPVKGWVLSLDAERGAADNVFTRVGNYDYFNIRARSRYQINRNLRFNLSFITRDNSNPTEVDLGEGSVSLADFGVETKSRIFSSSLDWRVNERLSFGGGYNYNWQENDADIDYAYIGTPNGGIRGRSLYFMRNHFFHFDMVAQVFPRVTLYTSYRVNKDLGQGDRISDLPGGTLITSYPMSFQSPEARVAFRLNRRLDWNVGYQYYNYNESKLAQYNQGTFIVSPRPQNYNAHLPYVSLRVYFGNGDR